MKFTPFPKIARLRRILTITEKIDGANAAVKIVPVSDSDWSAADPYVAGVGGFAIYAQSRKKFITPGKTSDNFGFAQWVVDNAAALAGLGEGTHFGEWWGSGIQRGYGIAGRRFSLFNAGRWTDAAPPPDCCSVVPTLWSGPFQAADVAVQMELLAVRGSQAAPGFMRPEGIVIHHAGNNNLFKVTFEHDELGKGDIT